MSMTSDRPVRCFQQAVALVMGLFVGVALLPACGGAGDDSCEYANDGVCDEPELCNPGTDASDCGEGSDSDDSDGDDSDGDDSDGDDSDGRSDQERQACADACLADQRSCGDGCVATARATGIIDYGCVDDCADVADACLCDCGNELTCN